jgi:hypothetical protein
MKHLRQMLAVGSVLVGTGCADSMTRPSPVAESVPATIAVPDIRGSVAGKFEFNADGSRHYIQDGGDGSGNCYDICDSGGGTSGGGSAGGGSEYDDPRFQGPHYTEAYFEGDVLKGHAEMSFTLADHASQDMSLSNWRPDGSILGTQKYTTAQIWPLPVVVVLTMTTDGAMPAPRCGGRGQGTTLHDVSSAFKGYGIGQKATSYSTIMNQPLCQSTQPTTQSTTVSTSSGGLLKICQREDHYSASGEYIDTMTLYCYYTYAT